MNHEALSTNPQDPAYAFRIFEASAVEQSKQHAVWQPGDSFLPSIFISYGAPPLFEDAEWIDELFSWSTSMPKPKGIVVVSAHWETAPVTISAPNPNTALTYDFGGFHPYYYGMQWRSPDASMLGERVSKILSFAGEVNEQHSRGLDHGAWVPLKVMYPLADIPTVQVSIPTHKPETLLEMGKRLGELREEGVLVVGSGFMTHGLPYITPQMIAGEFPSWSQEFDAWAWEAINHNDIDTLAKYKTHAPGMPYAHPTVEHFTPIFLTLGAKREKEKPTTTIEGSFWGLAKRSFEFN